MDDSRPLKVNRRWYRLTPDRFLLALLPIVGLLFLSERFRWFAFNEHKNWTVLIAVAVVCVAVVLLLLWLGISLVSRLRFQFSIRSLMLFVAVVAVVCSWFSVRMQQARKQREAVEVIEKAGGGVTYESLEGSSVPEWVRTLLGDDFFVDVHVVWGGYRLANLNSRLPLMDLDGRRAFMESRPPRVLSNEPVFGGNETPYFKGLTNLQTLFLDGSQITDAGLKHLEGLTKVTELYLNHTEITDAGLEHLEGLTTLRRLDLIETQVTDAGLEHLEGLTNLEWLYLSDTQITDAGLAGLEHLEGLTNLERLDFRRPQVTDQGVKRLQEALPNCKIRH